MTYTLTNDPNTVLRDEDQAHIPFDEANTDYQNYLAWRDEGNEPAPHVPPPATEEPEPDLHARVGDIEARLSALETDLGR